MAGAAGKPLVTLDGQGMIDDRNLSAEEILLIGLSESYRCGGILLIDECEELLAPEGVSAQKGPFLKLLEQAEGLVILTTNLPIKISGALERRIPDLVPVIES